MLACGGGGVKACVCLEKRCSRRGARHEPHARPAVNAPTARGGRRGSGANGGAILLDAIIGTGASAVDAITARSRRHQFRTPATPSWLIRLTASAMALSAFPAPSMPRFPGWPLARPHAGQARRSRRGGTQTAPSRQDAGPWPSDRPSPAQFVRGIGRAGPRRMRPARWSLISATDGQSTYCGRSRPRVGRLSWAGSGPSLRPLDGNSARSGP